MMFNNCYDKQPFILASASPRRSEILERVGVRFEVHPAQSEHCPDGLPPAARVTALARSKAEEVAALFPDRVVIGADTMVFLDDMALGKPHSTEEAVDMLMRLQGREHTVITGVWVCTPDGCDGFADSAAVQFYPMTRAEAEAYVATGEPMDKAGAYAVQGYGTRFVAGIHGDFFNVMGLPAARLIRFLSGKE